MNNKSKMASEIRNEGEQDEAASQRLRLRAHLSSGLVFNLALFLFISVALLTTTLNLSHYNWRHRLIHGLNTIIFHCPSRIKPAFPEACENYERILQDHIDLALGTIIFFCLVGLVLDGIVIVIVAREDYKAGIIFVWLTFHNCVLVLALFSIVMIPVAMIIYMTTRKMRAYSKLFPQEMNAI